MNHAIKSNDIAARYPHYFKDVSGLEYVDVYRVLKLFEVHDPCIQHAVKKLLCTGARGEKSTATDVEEAIASLRRWQAILIEDEAATAK